METKRVNDISLLYGEPKEYEIKGVGMITLRPFDSDELSLFAIDENSSAEEKVEVTKNIVKKALKMAFPNVEEEKLKISYKYLPSLMEAISDINGLTDNTKAEFLKGIKEKQKK